MKKIGNSTFKNLFFIFLLFPLLTKAAQFEVTATVDRNQMGVGDSFNLNIHVKGDEDFELTEPKVPTVAGLELLNSWAGGRQSASSMSMINGKTQFTQSISQDYNFMFSPQKEGTFLIPVIDVQIKGQSYKTNPIKIEVAEEFRGAQAKKNQKAPKGRPSFPPGFGDEEDDSNGAFGQMPDPEDLFNQLMKQRQRMFGNLPNQGRGFGQQEQIKSRKLDISTNDAFFLYLDLDKTEVYEGEQVTANWYIYSKGNLESIDRVKFPDLKGFWKEIIEEVPGLQFTPEIVNGVMYNKALLASHALFPIKAGTAIIDEFKIKGKVRMQTQFGWGQSHEYTKVSKRTVLKVLPLPMEGRPPSFSGAVGTYRVSAKTDGSVFPAHQPFSVKIRFEGMGNAKLIDLPNIQWPDSLEIFDTKNESKYFKDGQSFKEFEVLVISRKEGEVKIPKINFSYFDPKQKKYVTDSTEEISLSISHGTAQTNANVSDGKASVAPVASDASVETFKAQPILELPQSAFSFANYRLYFYAVVLLIGLLIFIVYFISQYRGLHQEPEFQQLIAAKIKLIETIVLQSQSADSQQNLNAQRKIGSEAVNLIYLLAAYLAGQRKADQEWGQLIKEIPIKYQNQFLPELTKLFDYFQLLGFSPEEIVKNLLVNNPIESQMSELKKMTDKISTQAKAEERS